MEGYVYVGSVVHALREDEQETFWLPLLFGLKKKIKKA